MGTGGDRGTGNGERRTTNRDRETMNQERGTGNRKPVLGVWRRVHSGNPPENSKWQAKEKKSEQVLQL